MRANLTRYNAKLSGQLLQSTKRYTSMELTPGLPPLLENG